MTRLLGLGIALAAAFIGTMLFYQSAAFSSRGGSDAPLYSARRHDPYGTAALQDLLTERGVQVRTLERPALEPSDRGVLIQVLSDEDLSARRAGAQVQTRQLADWISDGNTVVQFTRGQTNLMARFKLESATKTTDSQVRKLQEFEARGGRPSETPAVISRAPWHLPGEARQGRASAAAGAAQPLLLWSPMVFASPSDAAWTPIASLPGGDHGAVAAQYRIGKGKLILVGAPTPALNGTLGEDGNLEFLLAVIGAGPVLLDEWSHGIGNQPTVIGFVRDAGLLPVLLQMVLCAMLYVWSTSGYLRREAQAAIRQRSSIEQIQTLGFLYSRSLGGDVTFSRVSGEVQRRLAEALRCNPAELTARAKTLKPELREKFEQVYARLARLHSAHAPRCQGCGYDLSRNVSGRCPECGWLIPFYVRERVAEAAPEQLQAKGEHRRGASDRLFAEVLTLSNQLTGEVQRDRRALR